MNTDELRGEMARHRDTQDSLARALGISKKSMWQKLNGKRDFWRAEIAVIIQKYDLKSDDVTRIFFA